MTSDERRREFIRRGTVLETVFGPPQHPYTEALLSAVPTAEGEERPRIRLAGDIPSHADPPSGCVFHTRCPRFIGDVCVKQEPPLREVEPGHMWRCHYTAEELRELQAKPPDQAEANAKRASGPSGNGTGPDPLEDQHR